MTRPADDRDTGGMGILLDHFGGTTSRVIDAAPADVFARITDVPRLPEWNARIHHVIEAPTGPLAQGTEWVVEMRVMGMHWPSRARVTGIDAEKFHLEHTSRGDDGNPSFALWTWQVRPVAADRSEVRVTWSGNPRSFWRRFLLARVRRPQLADEVQVSLGVLSEQLRTSNGESGSSVT
jgi:hypothetical protein